MMWSDIDQQGLILVCQGKTGKRLWIPLHTRLLEILPEIPRNSTHILTSAPAGLGRSSGLRPPGNERWGRMT